MNTVLYLLEILEGTNNKTTTTCAKTVEANEYSVISVRSQRALILRQPLLVLRQYRQPLLVLRQ